MDGLFSCVVKISLFLDYMGSAREITVFYVFLIRDGISQTRRVFLVLSIFPWMSNEIILFYSTDESPLS